MYKSWFVVHPPAAAAAGAAWWLVLQAFEVVTRPALDSAEAALDRVKMAVYTKFAEWGLPCPVTGAPAGRFRDSEAAAAGQS